MPRAEDNIENGVLLNEDEWLEKCRRYLRMRIELMFTEEVRQHHFSDKRWPPYPRWRVNNVYDMPIVVWLSELSKHKGQKRTAVTRDGHTAAGNHRHRNVAASFGVRSGAYEC